MRITDLCCEYMPAQTGRSGTPPCVGTERPCFSFITEDVPEGAAVRYYKILVSSSASLLNDNNGDMWDSGLVYSPDTRCIIYGGKPLSDKKTYYFRAFAMVGKTALKSRPGAFNTGITRLSGWRGGYITACKGAEILYFKREITVKRGIRHAYAYVAGAEFTLFINGKTAGSQSGPEIRGAVRYRFFDLTDDLSQGVNTVVIKVCTHNEKDPPCILFHLDTEYDDGSASIVVSDEKWTAGTSPDAAEGCAAAFCPESCYGAVPCAGKYGTDFPCQTGFASSDGKLNSVFDEVYKLYGEQLFTPYSSACRALVGRRDVFGYVEDLYTMQRPNGSLPDEYEDKNDTFGTDSRSRGEAAFDLPYGLYTMYGDARIISGRYGEMEKYYAFLKSTSDGFIRKGGGSHLTETARFAADALMMKRISEALGYDGKAAYYGEMYEKTREAWYESFEKQEEYGIGDVIGVYSSALKYGLLPNADNAADILDAAVKNKKIGNHIAPHTASDVVDALCDHGGEDSAYAFITELSAERPDLYGGAFRGWLYTRLLGIRPLAPGYRRMSVSPFVGGSVDRVSGSFRCAAGNVTVEWEKSENTAELKVAIPADVTATVSAPGYGIVRADRQRPVRSVECKHGVHAFTLVKIKKETIV